MRIGAQKARIPFGKRKVYNRSRSGMNEGEGKVMDQSSDSLKTLSPIGKAPKPTAEDLKDLEPFLTKSDKSITGKENIAQEVIKHRSSMGTFLGEGCASFLSQPSLISKLTQHTKITPTKLVPFSFFCCDYVSQLFPLERTQCIHP